MEAQTLHCSSCGAAVSTDHPVCRHCGSRLATMACPTCFDMMFQGTKYCAHCGAPAVTWVADPSKLKCPGCESVLLRGELGGAVLHQCAKCFGFWVDRTTFERICRDAQEQSVLPSAAAEDPAPPRPMAPIRYVKCPECHTLMHRINFAGHSGIVIDDCRKHGTWFDAHELNAIVEFIRAGGMDQARERDRRQLAEEKRRVENLRQLADTPTDPWVAGKRPVRMDGFPGVIRLIGALMDRHHRGH